MNKTVFLFTLISSNLFALPIKDSYPTSECKEEEKKKKDLNNILHNDPDYKFCKNFLQDLQSIEKKIKEFIRLANTNVENMDLADHISKEKSRLMQEIKSTITNLHDIAIKQKDINIKRSYNIYADKLKNNYNYLFDSEFIEKYL